MGGDDMLEARIITLDELTARQAEGRVAEFWNVLTDDYYTGELIPLSRRVPLDRVGREASNLPKDTDVVVYCSGTDCPQSKAAGEKLAVLGFENARVFEGGLEAWKEAGRPVREDGQAAA
jgi:rhodanese-related sulfurtransferase